MTDPRAGEAANVQLGSRLARALRHACADDWVRVFLAAALVGAVLASAGGFGTGAIPIVGRFAYWLSLVAMGVILGRTVGRRVIPRPWFETRPILVGVLMLPIIGLPVTLLAALGNAWLRGRAFAVSQLFEILPSVLATTAGMIALSFLVQSRTVVETHQAPVGAPRARFLDRLPAKLEGADLWAVEAEDHYLRLHTSRGQDLILMRLADAIIELDGLEGARTHRSWWVARAAVAGVERADGRATLGLPSGLRAPVSRAYVKALREAGWF